MASDSKVPPNKTGKYFSAQDGFSQQPSFNEGPGLNDPLVGAQFGPYRIIGRIADGERGEIYFAEEPGINRKVAVKVFREEYCRDQEALKAFHQEVKLVKDMGHDGMAEVYDVGWTTDKRVYLVMGRLQGETLQDRMDRGPIPFLEALPIIGQTLSALAALHERGVAHRDLRPDRIFLVPTPEGYPKVKLMGIGVSRLVNLDDLRRRLPKLSATSGGAIAAHYLSPEQIVNKPVDARTDVFAMGIILYEAFAGQLPFAGLGVIQVLAKQAQGQLPPLPPLDPQLGVPIELSDVIAKTTRREPVERYPNAEALLSEISDIAMSRGMVISQAAPKIRRIPTPLGSLPAPSGQSLPQVNVQQPPMTQQEGSYPPGATSPYTGNPVFGNQQYNTPAVPYAVPQHTQGHYSAPHSPVSGNYPIQQQYPHHSAQFPPHSNTQGPPAYQQTPNNSSPHQGSHAAQGQYYPQNTPNTAQTNHQDFLQNAYGPPSASYETDFSAQKIPSAPTQDGPALSSPFPSAGFTQWSEPQEKKPPWLMFGGLVGFLLFASFAMYSILSGPDDEKPPVSLTQETTSVEWDKITEKSLPIIRESLADPKPAIRARAAKIVGLIRDQDRMEELVRARVTDKDTLVRAEAAKALGQIGDRSVIPRLRDLRETADPSAQLYLDEALFRLGDREAKKRLRAMLSEKDRALQVRATKTLAELGDRAAIPHLRRLAKSTNQEQIIIEYQGLLTLLGDKGAYQNLLGILKNTEPMLRIGAAKELREAGFQDGLETLSYLYTDTQSPYRLQAAKIAASPGDQELEQLFIDFIENYLPNYKDPRTYKVMQLYIAEGLALCGSSDQAIQTLFHFLDSPHQEVSLAAAGGLMRIKARQPAELLKEALRWAKASLSDINVDQRVHAAAALAFAPSNKATLPLERALKDPNQLVVEEAIHSLGVLGQVSALRKMSVENSKLTAQIGAALLKVGDDKRGNLLLKQAFFDPEETELRKIAIHLSAEAGNLSYAKQALEEDPAEEVRFVAAVELARAEQDAGLPLLLKVAKSNEKENSLDQRLEAKLALWVLGRPDEEAGNPSEILKTASPRLQASAARFAHRLPLEEAVAFYYRALAIPDITVRRSAIQSLMQLEKTSKEKAMAIYVCVIEDSSPEIRAIAAFGLTRLLQ